MAPPTDEGEVRVSGIVPDPRHPGTVRIEVAGRTLLTVPAALVAQLGVEVGRTLAAPAHAALCHAADAEGAYRTALICLERRPFARRDLARRLVMRGHPPGAADAAVERATAAGLLDDERFARHFVQTRSVRGRGPARLRRELTAMGVAPPLVDRVLAEEMPADGAREAILTLARKRARQLQDVPHSERLRRVTAYLARRGYAGFDVRRVVREAMHER